ncbi:MAG: hypothetical protein E7425_10505 [Ruminococcaceae bacterium]|nr:hypothetical protein [Oscillospiraceae bacterium]
MSEATLKKLLFCAVMLLVAVVSYLYIADRATSLEANRAILASIDEKSETVLKLTAASTIASASISAIPGDTATPIAGKLADFTEYFLLILCVLYAEKYLLAVIGAAAFKLMIPCACLLQIVGAFWNPDAVRRLSLRFALIGVALFVTIPASIAVSDMVYDTYRQSLDVTVSETEALSDETSEFSEAGDDQNVIASILGKLSETASTLAKKAAKLLNRYVEALAVLIVTSCIIPLLSLVFFLWLFKLLTGVNVLGVLPPRRPERHADGGQREEASKP